MSVRLVIAIALLAGTATAAPVLEAKLTKEQADEFDRLWDAAKWRAADRVHLYCRLVKQPTVAVEYLTGHLPPMKLSEAEAKELIEALGSDDEKVWKKAFRD